MSSLARITSPDDPALDALCSRLAEHATEMDRPGAWPAEQLRWCGEAGVYEWFMDAAWGGQAWSSADIVRGYLRLSEACLTTTFVITQRTGACRRLAVSDNTALKERYLPSLTAGSSFATVGVSHLTTSRRHVKRPVMRAVESEGGFVLDGFSPWVTGAQAADMIVTGATLEDDRQILVALPTDLPGVSMPAPAELVGLSASRTGPVKCDAVGVPRELVLAGPVAEVMRQGSGANTGGLQTSTLAVGLAAAAITFLEGEARARPDLRPPGEALRTEWTRLRDDLCRMAEGEPVCSNEQLRSRANSLVLRASQSALSAAKGSGYMMGHPAGRWCREALFFLVWSCPQPVMAANLCELAGLGSLDS